MNTQGSLYNMLPNPDYYFVNNVSENSVCEGKNRFVYINHNFINANRNINTKVLINPNFKQTVHINPNFKGPTKQIHVNPNILKITESNAVIKYNTENNSKDIYNKDIARATPIISTRTKLVRASIAGKSHYDPLKLERRKSLHTTYKIVHCNDDCSQTKSKLDRNYFKNRYKLDKSILKTKKSSKNNLLKSRYRLRNVSTTISKSNELSNETKQANSKYISINGTLYKKTPNVLRKADLIKRTSTKVNTNKNKILLRRGKLYKLDYRQKMLKVLPITPNGRKYNHKDNSLTGMLKQRRFVFINKNKRKIILSDINNSRNHILIGKMRKCNVPCPIYRRFGKCKAKELGRCIRVHNPNQIMMCMKFLQGACFDSNCLLSHKVSAEKMPTCKYYLEGICTKEDCVYLHVKINAKAEICKNFLEGFCEKAKECDKRHQFLCPDYEKNGSCPKKRCQYPHGNMVRKTNVLNKVAKRIVKTKSIVAEIIKAKHSKHGNNEQVDKNPRYYAENSEEIVTKCIGITIEDNLDNKCNLSKSDSVKYLNLKLLKRAQLGVLPSFIPIGDKSANSLANDVQM